MSATNELCRASIDRLFALVLKSILDPVQTDELAEAENQEAERLVKQLCPSCCHAVQKAGAAVAAMTADMQYVHTLGYIADKEGVPLAVPGTVALGRVKAD